MTTTQRAMARACAITYMYWTWRAPMSLRCRRSRITAGAARSTWDAEETATRCGEVIDSVQEVTGRTVPVRVAARRGGDPAVLVASSDRIRSELGWTARFQRLDTIVESAWRWLDAEFATNSTDG